MTLPSGFFVGQIGAKIILNTRASTALLASATGLKINYKLPSGNTGSWTAQLDGSYLTYTTTAITDFPQAGEYQLQAYAEGIGWKFPGSIATMLISSPIIAVV